MIWTGNVLLLSQISHLFIHFEPCFCFCASWAFKESKMSWFLAVVHWGSDDCSDGQVLYQEAKNTGATFFSLEFGSHHCCRTLFGGWWRWVGAGMRWGGFPENSWSLRLCGWNPPWDPNCPPSRYTKVAAFLIRTLDALFSTHGDAGIGWTRGWEWSRVLDKCVISSSSPQKGNPHGRLIAHIRPLYQCNCATFSPWN